jgi:hypothetical protein
VPGARCAAGPRPGGSTTAAQKPSPPVGIKPLRGVSPPRHHGRQDEVYLHCIAAAARGRRRLCSCPRST